MKMFRRTLSYFMMIVMFVFLFSRVNITNVSANERFNTENGYLEYRVQNNNEITITNYSGTDTKLNIPSKINGKSVIGIGDLAFNGCSNLTSIIIPNSVTNIGDSAFKNCTSLINIIIPNSIKKISFGLFWNCSNLKSITIPNSITSIRGMSFCGCNNLENMTIPNSVISIESGAFFDCNSLKSIIIPNSVTSIGKEAFGKCSNLTSITIPTSIRSLEDGVFSRCTNLKSINIPSSVKSIGYKAFEDCSNLTNITIPTSVTNIGEMAFKGCDNLTSITIPNSVTSIGEWAFWHCDNLRKVTISNSVTNIENFTFCYCVNLTSIIIPSSVTSIENGAFFGCYNLTKIIIPYSVINMKNDTFEDCIALTVYGYKDSYAETYAKEYSIPFKDINEKDVYIYRSPNTLSEKMKNLDNNEYKAISLEAGFYEVEFEDDGLLKRGYIEQKDISNPVDVPIVYSNYTNIQSAKKYYCNINSIINLSEKLNVYYGPSKKYVLEDRLEPGTKVTLLYEIKESALTSYYKIQYETQNGVRRGYCLSSELNINNKDNTLEYFNKIKSQNARLLYNGKFYYSDVSGIDSENKYTLNGWNIVESMDLSFNEYNIMNGITSAIASNSDQGWDGDKNNPYVNENNKEGLSVASDCVSIISNFLAGVYSNTRLKVNLEKYKGENRIVIFTGEPIESAYKGKKMSLYSLLQSKTGNYLIDEDKYIRSMFKGLSPEGKYSMEIQFSNLITTRDFGYTLVLSKDGNIYSYPIIHEGTSMKVYHKVNGKSTFVFDAATLLCSAKAKLEDEAAQKIKAKLVNNGFVIDYKEVLVKCPVDVEVYNNTQLIGRIKGNAVDETINSNIALDVNNDIKIIGIPNDIDYKLNLIATDNGNMEYSISDVSMGMLKERYNFYDVPLEKDKEIIFKELDTNTSKLNSGKLILSNGSEILPSEKLSEEDIDKISVNVLKEGEGKIIGNANYSKGDYVSLEAIAEEGYIFEGWYKGDTKLQGIPKCFSFIIKEDVTLKAKFIKNSLLGDIDGNGKINSFDALKILQISSRGNITEVEKKLADINKDGKVNSLDALMVLQYSTGKRESLE